MDKNLIKLRGIVYVIISGISFGVIPILAKLAYNQGANAINTLALRFVFSSVFLYLYIRYKNISIKISKEQLKIIVLLSLFGYSMTSIFLFISYNYISSGIATMILYSYPVMVMILSVIIYKEKFQMKKFLYLMLTTLGVGIMLNVKEGQVSFVGIILVLLSALSYAIYVIGCANEKIKDLNSFTMTFYITVITAGVDIFLGFITKSFHTSITFLGIVYIIILAIVSTIIGFITFLKGVKVIGPTNASIFSCSEPIVSLVLGVIVLKESINLGIVVGSIIIITVMIFMAKETVKN